MSSFIGRMREYADISIDRFDGVNLDSNAYFLSHNHSDHTVGLASETLRYRLQSEHRIKLYCSEVTHHLLLCFDRYKHLANSMVALPLNEASIISVPDIATGKEKYKLNVTLLPAGHCPGSVMFLFEGHEETVLYTGDFRLDHGDISRIEALKSGSGPKELKSLYIDTTFCVPAALFIPSREESSNAVISIAEEWISQSRRHMVVITYRALLGYEDLFRRLSEHFNMRVHVTNEKYKQYLGLADLSKFTTPHPEDTQIHACKYLSGRTVKATLPCGYTPSTSTGGEPPLIRTIKVSTMAFVKPVAPESYALRYNDTSFHVCYSFHSSYGELREVILFLRPHHAFPNVIPMGDTMSQIQERLDSLAELARRSVQLRSPWQHRELGKLKRKRKWRRPMTQHLEQSESLDFGESESSPDKRLCSNSRQPVKVKFPLLMGGSDCEEPGTGITADHKGSSQEKHSSGEDSNYQPSDTEPLDASFDLFDEDIGVLEEEKNVMQSFTPTKGGSYGEFAFYVSDDDEDDDGVSGVDRRPEVEPAKAAELCPVKSQKSENGFIVSKLKTDLEVRGTKASWGSVVVESKEATVREPMNVEQLTTDGKAPETTGALAASELGREGDTQREERQRNAAQDVETIKDASNETKKDASNETNSNKSNAQGNAIESITSHPSKSVSDTESSRKDGNESNRTTIPTEPVLKDVTPRRTEETPMADVSSTTRTTEEATSTGDVGASAIGSGSQDEKVVGAAGTSRDVSTHEAVSDVDTQGVSSSIKPEGDKDTEPNKLDESLVESGKCRSGDAPEKKITLDDTKSTENGKSTEKAGDDADVPVGASAIALPASQKHRSPVNGNSKKGDSKEHVNGEPRQVKKLRSRETAADVSGRDHGVPAVDWTDDVPVNWTDDVPVNWTDEVIVIDDDEPAPTPPAPASGPRWSSNVTVDITCETTDSDATVDPTEGVLPRGCCPDVRPAVRNRSGAVLAVSGLMLDDTSTSSSDSYVSPAERRRRRRRWRKPRWSNSRPGDASYFHRRHVTGNNPGPSGSKPRLGGGATIDLTSDDDDTEAAPDVGGAGDAGVADTGVAMVDGYYADNEGGQSDSDASTAAEYDEADSPLFKAKRDSSRDVVITSDVDVIVVDDDTSDDCASKDDGAANEHEVASEHDVVASEHDDVASEHDDVASEHDTRTVVQRPIAVSDGAVEK